MSTLQVPAAGSGQSVASIAQRPRVLLAEDDVMVGEMLCEALEEDCEVICVADSEAALVALAAQHIDVVLLDYWLAGGSGQAVAEQADRSGVPMVWMTGEPEAARGLTPGSHAFLLKPFSIQRVQQALAKALGRE